MIWHRMRNDFDLAIVTVFGAVAIIGIAPFAVYRYFSGNIPAAIMDAAIVIGISFALADAWLNSNAKRAGLFMTVATNVGCIVSASLLGLAGLFWTFPVLLVNFLLLGRRMALAASIFTLSFLAWHGKAFDSSLELAMFLVSASVVGILAFMFALRTETQRKQLESLAFLDPLTGAQNRRAMDQELDIAIKTNARDNSTFGLAVMDLDHFKRINDRYGHEEGDEVLINFSNYIRKNSRKMDRFFRMGGEEFVLLLPAADADSLHTIIEHHCQYIEQYLRCNDEAITVSIGGAILKSGEDRHEWLARADAALYAAKQAGRNRTVVDDGSSGKESQ